MRLIAPYTESHSSLADRFRRSFKDTDIALELVPLPTIGSGEGNFQSESWRNAVVAKQRLVLANIKRSQDEILIVADVDIQFFRPIRPVIESTFGGGEMDIAFQAERSWPGGGYNAGFIAIRCSDRVLALYEAMLASNIEAAHLLEQDWLNQNLGRFPIVHSAFPAKIWAWTHGPETISRDIVLHHANGTVGGSTLAQKMDQLDFVRDYVLGTRQSGIV